MTRIEYLEKLKAIEDRAEKKKNLLAVEFAMSRNPYGVGEVVKDHLKKIEIEEISVKFDFGSRVPKCSYCGPMLKKDGTPYKNGRIGHVHQSNVIEDRR